MDPFSFAGAGLNVLGALAGEWWASADDAERDRLMQQAADEYGNVDPAVLNDLIAQQTGPSALEDMASDYGNKGSRNAAIQALVNEGLAGGNSMDARLAQADAQRTAGQASRSASQSALSSAAQRGTGGASATLQAQLLGGSQGADRAAQVGLQGASDARRNALAALAQGGGMAGQAEANDSSMDARRRESMDRIAMFNAGQRTRADEFNSGLAQQRFDNSVTLADRRSGADQMRAGIAGAKGDKKRGIASGVGRGLGQAASGYGQYRGK